MELPRPTGDTGSDELTTVPAEHTTPTVLSSTPCDACGGDCLVEELAYDQRYHTTLPVDYASVPPAGGPHDPCWTTFGVHATEVETARWVHNLEHGGVALLHDCVDCEADVASLEQVATGSPFGLALPYPAMDGPFAVVSWGFRWTAGCWDEAAARDFVLAHQDQAPESVLAGPSASCQ